MNDFKSRNQPYIFGNAFLFSWFRNTSERELRKG